VICRWISGGIRFHISSSVKSTAGAISTRPASEGPPVLPCRASARASSRATQPPMDEPIATCGPVQQSRKTAALSSSQRPMVPWANIPPDSPWPE
jgi:hypothetical protein